MPLEPLVIERKRICKESWWCDQPRQYFTRICAQMTNTLVPCDDVSDQEVQLLADRQARQQAVIEATA